MKPKLPFLSPPAATLLLTPRMAAGASQTENAASDRLPGNAQCGRGVRIAAARTPEFDSSSRTHGWLQNKFEKNFLVTIIDYVFNWARR
jgi:hypothetical protein